MGADKPTSVENQTDEAPKPMVMGNMNQGSKHMSWMMVVIAVVVALAGLGAGYLLFKSHTNKNAAPVAVKTYKIGFIGPLTGDVANYGEVMQRGVELAQRDFSASNINFQILVRDTQCDPKLAGPAAQELINAGVVAIIGDTCSGATLAALPYANQHKVLIISPAASSAKLSIADDYFVRTYPTDSHQTVFTTQYMYQKGIKKLGIIYTNESYGQGIDTSATSDFKKQGGTVVSSQPFTSGDVDLQSQLQAIAAQKPDALYIASNSEASGAAIVTEAKQMGLTIPIYGSDALKDASFLADVGKAGEGMTLVAVTPGNRAFLDEYKATYGSVPANATGAQAYDAFMALASALQKGNTGAQLLPAVLKEDFQGKSGEVKFDSAGDLAGGGYLVYTIKDGQFSEVNQQ